MNKAKTRIQQLQNRIAALQLQLQLIHKQTKPLLHKITALLQSHLQPNILSSHLNSIENHQIKLTKLQKNYSKLESLLNSPPTLEQKSKKELQEQLLSNTDKKLVSLKNEIVEAFDQKLNTLQEKDELNFLFSVEVFELVSRLSRELRVSLESPCMLIKQNTALCKELSQQQLQISEVSSFIKGVHNKIPTKH